MLQRAIRRYAGALEQAPIRTKALTGASLGFIGDAIAQKAKMNDSETFDYRRLGAFTLFGCGWTGLYNHWWYGKLAKWYPGTTVSSIVKKLAWNHCVSNPFVYLPVFYVSMGAMLGLTSDEVVAKAKAEYGPTLLRFWTVWMPANALMFRMVPLPYQVVYTATVSLGWNTALSIIYAGGRRKASKTKRNEEESHAARGVGVAQQQGRLQKQVQ
jgi:protein Mpv17